MDHCLVFPSRRAGLYFLKYYARQIGKPVWAPVIMTISEFFGSQSDLIVADNELLLFELYKVYRKHNKSAESFDEFYFWGDILLNDFDDVDKYRANVSVLFRNVRDYRNIDNQFGDIDPEQAEIIKRFWKNFEPERLTPQKNGFISIWSILNEMYLSFRDALRVQNMAYEGMIFRDIAEMYLNGEYDKLRWNRIHFIGFNALNECEKTVMLQLQKQGRAYFYWDYDNSYIKKGKLNSAGLFLTGNLRLFNNDMPPDWNYETFLTDQNEGIKRNIIETTSDLAQVKLIPALLDQFPGSSPEDAHHTAIILADEHLIIPLLSSLPANIGDINITMGYPLKMTGIYNLVRSLFNLQRNGVAENGTAIYDYKDVFEVLRHELISNVSEVDTGNIITEIIETNLTRIPSDFICRTENLGVIFRKAGSPLELSDYIREILTLVSVRYNDAENGQHPDKMQQSLSNEFIYRIFLVVNRLDAIVRSPDVSFSNETYIRILDKILRNQSVPFSGEPLSGIQIMGFLETRALDFRNIIMLSVNEGILPSGSKGSSFIPFSLREAFGLPVINHQESIYAYHFFRLLHRAENVTFIYNSDSTGLRTGEMSRFLIQMKYEQIMKPSVINLGFDIRTPVTVSQMIWKEESHLKRLNDLYVDSDKKVILSPSAINTWLNCRMKFYYRYVNGLREPEIISAEIDHAAFGQILHAIMKNIYQGHRGNELTREVLSSVLSDENYLLETIDQAINQNYKQNPLRTISGNDIIVRDILLVYLQRILKTDINISPFAVIELEKQFHFEIFFEHKGNIVKIKAGGNIDRIDVKEGIIRIVDYKTGSASDRIGSISELFEDDREREQDGWLQTIMYCEAYLKANQVKTIQPVIYKVREISAGKHSEKLLIHESRNNDLMLDNYHTIREEFLAGLTDLVNTIFNPDEPFRMTEKTYKCRYCPYSGLCQR